MYRTISHTNYTAVNCSQLNQIEINLLLFGSLSESLASPKTAELRKKLIVQHKKKESRKSLKKLKKAYSSNHIHALNIPETHLLHINTPTHTSYILKSTFPSKTPNTFNFPETPGNPPKPLTNLSHALHLLQHPLPTLPQPFHK